MTQFKTMKEIHKLFQEGKKIKINTPEGYKEITKLYEKIDTGWELFFDNNESIKCACTHLLVNDKQEWVSANEISIGDAFIGKDNKIIKLTNKVYLKEQKWLDFSIDTENEWYFHKKLLNHNSGKSLILFIIIRYLLWKNVKTLLIVPDIGLVNQMESDMLDYFYKTENNLKTQLNEAYESNTKKEIQSKLDRIYNNRKLLGFEKLEDVMTTIFGGKDKTTNLLTISTWQSIFNENEKYFSDIQALVFDECLHPNTLISMKDGVYKKICDINIGDVVKTINEKTKVIEYKQVLKVHKNLAHSKSEQMYSFLLENGKELKITGNHKVNTYNRGWVRADELTLDDDLII